MMAPPQEQQVHHPRLLHRRRHHDHHPHNQQQRYVEEEQWYSCALSIVVSQNEQHSKVNLPQQMSNNTRRLHCHSHRGSSRSRYHVHRSNDCHCLRRAILIFVSFILLGNCQQRFSNYGHATPLLMIVTAAEHKEVSPFNDDEAFGMTDDDIIILDHQDENDGSSSSSISQPVSMNLPPTLPSSHTTATTSASTTAIEISLLTEVVDVVAIIPDRTTVYANGIHNGLLLASKKYNRTLHIIEVGNFNTELSHVVLQSCIVNPIQPKIYIIWPIDNLQSKVLMKQLYETHNNVPIIQMDQLPSSLIHSDEDAENEGETDDNYIIGYAGPNDIERASNAGKMMVQAMNERNITQPIILGLGYPISYDGYHVNSNAFRQSIKGSKITLLEILPLERTTSTGITGDIRQNAYDQMVLILDNLIDDQHIPLHGVYAMDDDILLGAYQAIYDRRKVQTASWIHDDHYDHDGQNNHHDWLNDISLIGGVCNGARSLLSEGKQYATTLQSPILEAIVAMDIVNEYLTSNSRQQSGENKKKKIDTAHPIIRYTPNPIITGDTIQSMTVDFMNETFVADELCTWNLHYISSNGLVDKNLPTNICNWVECHTIPNSLIYTAHVMVLLHFIVAIICGSIVIMYRKTKQIITIAQPPFLLLVIVGSCIDTSSILFMNNNHDSVKHSSILFPFLSSSSSSSENDYNDSNTEDDYQAMLNRNCFVWPWLLTLGQMMTTATLVAKIYRVKIVTNATRRRRVSFSGANTTSQTKQPNSSFLSRLLSIGSSNESDNGIGDSFNIRRRSSILNGSSDGSSSGMRRVAVSARDVSGFILAGMVLDIVLLSIWFVKYPFEWKIQVVSHDAAGHILSARGTCTSSIPIVDDGLSNDASPSYYFVFPTLILLLHFSFLVYANVLAYQTRQYHRISDSHMVAISLFNSIQLLLVAMIMYALSGDNVVIGYVVRVCYAFLNNLGVLTLIVVPKVYGSLFGKDPTSTRFGAKPRVSGLHSPYGASSPTTGGAETLLSPDLASATAITALCNGTATTALHSGTILGSSGDFEFASHSSVGTPTSVNKPRRNIIGRPSLVNGLLAANTIKLQEIIEEGDESQRRPQFLPSPSPDVKSIAIFDAIEYNPGTKGVPASHPAGAVLETVLYEDDGNCMLPSDEDDPTIDLPEYGDQRTAHPSPPQSQDLESHTNRASLTEFDGDDDNHQSV